MSTNLNRLTADSQTLVVKRQPDESIQSLVENAISENKAVKDHNKNGYGLTEECHDLLKESLIKDREECNADGETIPISEEEMKSIMVLVKKFEHLLVELQIVERYQVSREEAKIIADGIDTVEFQKLASEPTMPAFISTTTMNNSEYSTPVITDK
jgi:hypothetical protein